MAIKTPGDLTRRSRILFGMGALLVFAPVSAIAMPAADPMIEGARLCTQYFPVEEKKNSIPTHLLAAIATTESGRWNDKLGMSVPWPWTINVEGKGYYFSNKAEAVAQTRILMAKGKQSIDVGCMQVNLKHHPKAFANLDEAFDPQMNVGYAARFLRDNYASLGDWIKATAAYHSRTQVHGQRYLGEIERSWNRIVAKVAAARATKGAAGTTVPVAASPVAGRGKEPLPKVVNTLQARPDPVSVAASSKPAMAEARRVRVISVSDKAARAQSSVIVVKATPTASTPAAVAEQPVKVADATPAHSVPAAPMGDSVRRVSLDNNTPGAVPQASGPKFVFAN